MNHTECNKHKEGYHDSLIDPNGCGHCNQCHNSGPYKNDPDGPRCGHYAGCPGC